MRKACASFSFVNIVVRKAWCFFFSSLSLSSFFGFLLVIVCRKALPLLTFFPLWTLLFSCYFYKHDFKYPVSCQPISSSSSSSPVKAWALQCSLNHEDVPSKCSPFFPNLYIPLIFMSSQTEQKQDVSDLNLLHVPGSLDHDSSYNALFLWGSS